MIDPATLLALFGPFPDRTDLNPRVLETADCGTYIREKVEYSVEADERIRAYVLIPKQIKPGAPAVFCHHQHDNNFELGKSEVVGLAGDPDQAYAAELAERGYVTLAPDAIAFEERNWSPIPARAEYVELSNRLVRGQTLIAKVLHDVSVGLDYLQSRPEVDPARIGFIGHSYGGRMAIWAPAFDKRIRVSVSHCGCVNYKNSFGRDTGVQMEFCIPNILQHADIEDIVTLIEPASLYLSATSEDRWSRGAQEIYDYARPAFRRGELKLKVWPGEHVFTQGMRGEAYAFLDNYLRP